MDFDTAVRFGLPFLLIMAGFILKYLPGKNNEVFRKNWLWPVLIGVILLIIRFMKYFDGPVR